MKKLNFILLTSQMIISLILFITVFKLLSKIIKHDKENVSTISKIIKCMEDNSKFTECHTKAIIKLFKYLEQQLDPRLEELMMYEEMDQYMIVELYRQLGMTTEEIAKLIEEARNNYKIKKNLASE